VPVVISVIVASSWLHWVARARVIRGRTGSGSDRGLAQRRLLSSLCIGPRPEDAPLGLLDREVVDARLAPAHQSVLVELPQLVAVASPPASVAVVTLVLKAHRDAVGVEAPEVLPQRVVELALPLRRQERDDLVAPCDEDIAVAPDGVDRVCLRDPLRVARVPGVFGGLHLLRRGLARERGQRWSCVGHDDPFVATGTSEQVYAGLSTAAAAS